MEKTIWKYELKTEDIQSVTMPKGGTILTLQTQNDNPCLWVLVDPNAEKEVRGFMIYGTGHIIPTEPYPHTYIGTYQHLNGLVFHVFEFTTPLLTNQ